MVFLWTVLVVTLIPIGLLSLGMLTYLSMLAKAETERQKGYATKQFIFSLVSFSVLSCIAAFIADKLISIYH